MRRIILVGFFVFLISSIGLVAQTGFTGPSNQQAQTGSQFQSVTVAQALTMPRRTNVTLTGYVISHIRGEYFMFRDSTGEMMVEIDRRHTRALSFGPNDLVEISGYISSSSGRTYVDVGSRGSIRLVR